jgi:hypothetical protein
MVQCDEIINVPNLAVVRVRMGLEREVDWGERWIVERGEGEDEI